MRHDSEHDNTSSGVRPPSPSPVGERDLKRRKVRTCRNCRRRKVQCDQATPTCGRCLKSGQAETCVYNEDPADTLSRSVNLDADAETGATPSGVAASSAPAWHPSVTLSSLLSRLEHQEGRILELEAELRRIKHDRVLENNRGFTGAAAVDRGDHRTRERVIEPENRIVKGKSFKTRFYGPTHAESLIAHIPDLATLSKDIVAESPMLVKLRQDLRAIGHSSEGTEVKELPVSRQHLESLLPPRAEVDELVHLYFQTYDPIYHIIHLPTFQKEYEGLWSNAVQARPHLVALVLLMIAISRCLVPKEQSTYVGKNSVARDAALKSIHMCEEWLRVQKQKHVTIADFQLRFLLCLAKSVTGTQFKRGWIEVGTALRFCVAAGLHVNPAILAKPTSALDKEMRRRMWSAMVEFEVQTAFVRGIASDPLALDSDTPPPNNIQDEDIEPGTQGLPPTRPLTDFTTASYLVVASITHTIRNRLTQLLNSRQAISNDEARNLTEQIQHHIDEIPQWNDDRLSEAPKALLQINLHQYLLALHNRRLAQATSVPERDFSRMVLVDTAVKVVDTHLALLGKGCHVLQLLCQDHLRAALSICHAVSRPNARSDSVIGHSIDLYADRVMSDVVDLIAGGVDHLGAGQQELWIAVVSKAFVKIQRDPNSRATYTQEAVHRMSGSYYRIMACQMFISPEYAKAAHPPAFNTDNHQSHALHHSHDGSAGELSYLDLDAISAWTFDEWTFETHGSGSL